MVKYDFLLYCSDLPPFLEHLQEAGMVHVETGSVEPDEKTAALLQKADSYEKIYNELRSMKSATTVNQAKTFEGDADNIVEQYHTLRENLAKIDAQTIATEKEIEEALPWGDFRRSDLERIEKSGVRIHYYSVSTSKFNEEWANRYPLFEAGRDSRNVYFLLLQHSPDFDFELPEVKPPAASATELIDSLKQLTAKRQTTADQFETLAASANLLMQTRKLLLEQIDFNLAVSSASNAADGNLKVLTGWLPKDKTEEFNAFLETQSTVYFANEKPEANDQPPILLKNNRFARLFEPLTKLYSLPNYGELDPTAFLAPFFMMFFGFCLGDGGYGLLILLAASIMKLKIKTPAIRPYLTLAQWLGAATMIFGFITATFFGFFFDEIKLDKMAEKLIGLPESYGMLYLSLFCGFVQIIFGMCLNVAKIVGQRGWKYAVAQTGWIVIILSGISLLAIDAATNKTANIVAMSTFVAGLLMAFFFNSPGKNPLINFGTGIWNAYNMASGLLGDILSYIRLFALGMTGGILGSVFNTLAVDAGDGVGVPVAAQLVTFVILIFGHGLNFMLGVLGAIIHPMRLTFVEFYKNAGFEGGGLPFKTFGKYE
jgi:V/A-type H+-transporting ATPase subunit I